jgi:hypothetical protein
MTKEEWLEQIEQSEMCSNYGGFCKKEWVGLTDDEIDQGLLRTKYAMQTAGAWRDGVEWATKQLKEKNT